MENWIFTEDEKYTIVKIPKERNHSLEELNQKLINYFYKKPPALFEKSDIEVFKILFENKKD